MLKSKIAPFNSELGNLLDLLHSQNYKEAQKLSLIMTIKYPKYGIGFKFHGIILHELKKLDESLIAKQKAVELLPNDAEANNNLCYILRDLKKPQEALKYARKSIKLNPNLAVAHNNLGLILIDLERYEEAENSCRRAIAIKPDFANGHNILGTALFKQKKFHFAIECYKTAIGLNSATADFYLNLANALFELGNIDKSLLMFEYAFSLNIGNKNEAFRCLGMTNIYSNDFNNAIICLESAFKLQQSDIGLESAVWAAIIRFVQNDILKATFILELAKPILEIKDNKYKNAKNYCGYLLDLISWRKLNPSHYYDVSFLSYEGKAPWQSLYVIGESHSLSSSALKITYNNQDYVCKSNIIIGCKEYHLGQTQRNKYKYNFEAIMNKLPQNSTILLTIGEIDCRQDEGIFKAWKKKCEDNNTDMLQQIMQTTISNYINYVASFTKQGNHKFIISGVPAINSNLDSLSKADALIFLEMVKNFNETLKEVALSNGMDFLDVYSLTNRGDGMSNQNWHIDGNHLYPSATKEAFDNYLVKS